VLVARDHPRTCQIPRRADVRSSCLLPSDTILCAVLLSCCPAVIVKGGSYESCGAGGSSDSDLDWSDFFFNLISMVIVYVYFSKSAAAGESMVAILLCMGVAGLDILLMALRWLWFDHYIAYG
jgi:hypothetical protein